MKIHSLRTTCSYIFLALMLWSCHPPEVSERILPAPQITTATEPDLCETDDSRWFDLTPIDPNSGSTLADLAFEQRTAETPYTMEECLCRTVRLELVYDSLPDSSKIIIRDEYGNSIPFSIVVDPETGNKVIIVKEEKILKGTTKYYIEMDVSPIPLFLKAGGLCIVDNLVSILFETNEPELPPITAILSTPTFITHWPLPGVSDELLILPEAMTSAYTHSIPY